MLSIAEENYIKGVFHLEQAGRSVSTNELAQRLQTKPASVTDMLKKLQAKNMLEYAPYYGVKLTTEGRKLALDIVRSHRLWEFFLVHTLGFDWDQVHPIAEQLEHIQQKEVIDRLDAFLGHPRFDPHGDPIPDAHGKMPVQTLTILPETTTGSRVIFTAVGDQSSELQHMLRHKKIALGDSIVVIEHFEFDQSMDIKVNDYEPVNISFKLAGMIFVSTAQ